MPTSTLVTIAAPDGIGLAATLWLPDGDGPFPAVLEALPYRKDDIAAWRDSYERFAAGGYAVCRVDVRGTGSSGGIATDEYPLSERTDLIAVIEWLASQPWSTGAVGMFGTSYSGFNSLQVAMERPAALKAIVSIFASDDRYADDVHYYGGALKALDRVDYPAYMVASNALPPVPSVFGDGWREEWERRVASTEPWVITWLEHQRRDAYWRTGSVREGYDRIEAPAMLVAGWADGYTNIAMRAFPKLRCPTRVLLGPWPHDTVETCIPGPNIDLSAEMLRWWDRWLKGADNGVDREPPIVLYAERSTLPSPIRPEVRGAWRYEPTWPPERLRPVSLEVADGEPSGVATGTGPIDTLPVRPDVGSTAWISCAGAMPWGQSADQRPDEVHSLTYTWPVLDDELEIWGYPELHVRVTSDAPVAYLSAKICDVFPDGTSSLVVRGMANLTQRDENGGPMTVEPGTPYDLALTLEACSWTFEAGHRIRLDLAGTDWPNAWPPPGPVTLSIDRSATSLTLPSLDGPSPVTDAPTLMPSPFPREDPLASDETGWARWEVTHDVLGRTTKALATYGGDEPAADGSPPMRTRYGGEVGVSLDDPGHAWVDADSDLEISFPEAVARARAVTTMRSDAAAYHLRIELTVSEDGDDRWHRTWERSFPRDLQ